MSNMKLVSLIEHRAQQSHREAEAIAQDVYAALIAITDPLRRRIEALEAESADLTLALPQMRLELTALQRETKP